MTGPTDPHSSDVKELTDSPQVLWQSLTRNQRRVAGVLVEKSKTTPDIYPMSLNGIKTGANQKSNRSPQLDLQEHQVEDVLYELRELGAVIEVHTGGRVPKYKHQLYEWLDVEPCELAVMAELLLRGEQTIGELRGRAGRMDRIPGVNELRPLLASLKEKGLIIELTPSGRGQIVSHNLYQPDELERLRGEYEHFVADVPGKRERPAPDSGSVQVTSEPERRIESRMEEIAELRETVASLQQTVTELQREIAEIRALLN